MKFTLIACVLALAGCASTQQLPTVDPDIAAIATEPLFCRGTEQCTRYWQRAQVWVARNSRWKIQTATDVLIETYGAGRTADRAYRVLREPGAGGVQRISIHSACGDYLFGCNTNELEQAAAFKLYVRMAD